MRTIWWRMTGWKMWKLKNIKLNCGFERYSTVNGHPPGNEKTYPTKRHNEKTSAQVGAGWQGIWDSFEEGSLTRQPEGVHLPSHWYIYCTFIYM